MVGDVEEEQSLLLATWKVTRSGSQCVIVANRRANTLTCTDVVTNCELQRFRQVSRHDTQFTDGLTQLPFGLHERNG